MNNLALEQRVARLEAIDAIRALKARYAALADQKYTRNRTRQPDSVMHEVARQQAECFTADAIWQGGEGFGSDLTGRAAIEQWFRRSPWRFALHFYTAERIDVIDADHAEATWRLWQIAVRDDSERGVLLAAITAEHYARGEDGAWRISRMRFEQLHMVETGAQPLPFAADFAGLDAIRGRAHILESE
jgi:hypothetical protein